jgi:hypothetical protein
VLSLIAGRRLDPTTVLSGPYLHADAVEILLDPPAGKPQFVRPRLVA